MSLIHHPSQVSQMAAASTVQDAKRYAFRLFGLYCLIYYCLPFLIFVTRGNLLEQALTSRPNYILGFIYVLFAFILFTMTLKLPVIRPPRMGVMLARLVFDPHLSLALAMFFVLFAIVTRNQMGLTFRQTGGSLADLGAIGFVMQILKAFFGVSILIHYRMLYENNHPKLRGRILLLIGVGFLVSIQAAFDVIYVFCAVLTSGYKWRRLLGLHIKFIRRLSILIIPLIMFCAIYVGIANKYGSERAIQAITGSDIIVRTMITRLGYHFFSTSLQVSENFWNFGMFFDAIQSIFGTFLYRASLLLGIDGIAKPEVVSIARMNFLQLGSEWRPRTGASPSVLGSGFFLPGAGFAIFYYVFIIRGVAIMLGRIMSPMGDNILFLLLSVVMLAGILDAFLDNVNPLSSGFFRLFTLFLGVIYVMDFLRNTVRSNGNNGVALS